MGPRLFSRGKLAWRDPERRAVAELQWGRGFSAAESREREAARLPGVNVTSARFRMDFHGVDGRRPDSLTFDVSLPDSCNLRNRRPERVALALKYLKEWGVAVG
jgi:hypothetical protein